MRQHRLKPFVASVTTGEQVDGPRGGLPIAILGQKIHEASADVAGLVVAAQEDQRPAQFGIRLLGRLFHHTPDRPFGQDFPTHLVQHLDRRVEPCQSRQCQAPQSFLNQRVDGADRRSGQVAQVGIPEVPHFRRRSFQFFLHRLADFFPQVRRRLAGEGDQGEPVEAEGVSLLVAVLHQRLQQQRHQHGGLARTGHGVDQQEARSAQRMPLLDVQATKIVGGMKHDFPR